MSVRLVVIALAALAAATLPGVARADGDPASDYLVSQQVFLSSDANIPPSQQRALLAAVASANKRGYPLKVALIWSSYDLGSVPELFGNPKTYARFLDTEDSYWFKSKTHLLVVMPQGFGFAQWKHSPAAGYRILAGIKVKRTGAGLATAATKAVVKLAAASGVTVSASSSGPLPTSSNRNTEDRIKILIAVAVALLIGWGARFLIRRRASRSPIP